MNKFFTFLMSAIGPMLLRALTMFSPRVAAGGLALASLSSFAAIDVTAATTGVSDASTAVLSVLAAMITMAAAIYGVKKVLRLLGR